ncbi:MAG TPA: hypothetical protein PLR99_07300 [Polyangiaceae bacterium]|jgi:hypothetical protein|nr:hypothetical protein [Polyangiaceae bacterium]
MAAIKTNLTGYKAFIKAFRAAFTAGAPFDATYERNPGNFTRFHYVVQAGAITNLYLTQITNGAAAAGPAAALRVLAPAEVSYAGAIGAITKLTFENALATDYSGAPWSAATKKAFDVVLLCTVEAARSKFIYTKVNTMLGGAAVDGDLLKDVAQKYGHTQTAAGLAAFRPLDLLDYRALYLNDKEKGNVALGVYGQMGL